MKSATHRDQLIGMLTEAAEIKHCLMCTYLYGAFSLKLHEDEGLTTTELMTVRRWRGEVIRIAADEMLHLALVSNLLIALGVRAGLMFTVSRQAPSFPSSAASAALLAEKFAAVATRIGELSTEVPIIARYASGLNDCANAWLSAAGATKPLALTHPPVATAATLATQTIPMSATKGA